jgi:hypothetical protein
MMGLFLAKDQSCKTLLKTFAKLFDKLTKWPKPLTIWTVTLIVRNNYSKKDVLEEFQEPVAVSKEDPNEEAFMKLLQENMAKMMSGEDGPSLEQMGQLMAAAPAATGETAEVEPRPFQDTISQTLNKLKSSDSEAQQKVTSGGDDFSSMLSGMDGIDEGAMEQMMKELEGLMETGEFEDMFGGLVNQLASKDLLYEPLKDLSSKVLYF